MQVSNEETEQKADAALNSSRICRFCLSPAGVMSPIFEEGEFNSLPLSSKIMAFISIQVYVNDGLPSLICHRCLYQVEKSYDFKTQCEASDAMLRKYLTVIQSAPSAKGPSESEAPDNPAPSFDTSTFAQFQKSLHSSHSDSPFKRKRGRPRKEENMMFYNSPSQGQLELSNGVAGYADEIKIVDGIESVVTVVDPRSDILSNSDEENKLEQENGADSDRNEGGIHSEDTMDSLAIAKAKAKKYMGVMIGVNENGVETKKHLCNGCGKTFGHCSDLRKHVLVHTGERPFHCRICTKTFSRSTNLNKHMKVHTGQKPYFCPDCPKSFATKGDLQRHVIIHSGVKPFGCHLCNQCFSRKDKLTRHFKLHENGGPGKQSVKCTSCPGVFHSKLDLRQHMEAVHLQEMRNEEDEEEEDGRSNAGDEVSSSKEALDLKEESSNDGDLVIKLEKEDSFQDSEASPEVESMVINLDPFQMESDLNDSMSTWENEKEKCDSKTKTTDLMNGVDENMALRFLVKKDGTDRPVFQCKVCYKKFSEPAYLRSHMVTHSTVKPHKCNLCEKSFTRRRELLRHENVHTGFKPFKCATCGKAFSRKDKLVRHEKIHNGVKKFPCSLCPSLSFTKVEDLLFHHRSSHSDSDLPYVLPTNSKSGVWYQCETCFVCYGNLKMFQDHLKTHEASNSSQEKENGVEGESEHENSDEEKPSDPSPFQPLEQLNSNPAITITSVSKSS